MTLLKAYLSTLAVFLALDALWLGLVARRFYASQLAGLMRDKIDFTVAGLFYAVYVGGIVHFAIVPALGSSNWHTAAINGALLGLIAYGTYDITNLATIRKWPKAISFVDLAWGCAVTGLSASIGYWLATAIF